MGDNTPWCSYEEDGVSLVLVRAGGGSSQGGVMPKGGGICVNAFRSLPGGMEKKRCGPKSSVSEVYS